MSDLHSYGFTQEQAASLGAPVCPGCGRHADMMTRVAYPEVSFEWDVVTARCSPCRLCTIVGSEEPWIQRPAPGEPGLDGFRERLNEIARGVHERPETKAAAEAKRRLDDLAKQPMKLVVR